MNLISRRAQDELQKGLTQEKLSSLAGIARSHLAALESGKKTVKLDTMWRIADALEIKPSEMIRRIENENGEKTQHRTGSDDE